MDKKLLDEQVRVGQQMQLESVEYHLQAAVRAIEAMEQFIGVHCAVTHLPEEVKGTIEDLILDVQEAKGRL